MYGKSFKSAFLVIGSFLLIVSSCQKDEPLVVNPVTPDSFKATPYNLVYPKWNTAIWLRLKIPADNPLTVEGIALGKKLFFDKILSVDNTIACASCHAPEHAFSDTKAFSLGVNNQQGGRNAMPLFNLAWADVLLAGTHKYFWDGRKATIEDQVLGPIADAKEMNKTYAQVVQDLRAHATYPALFKSAFGTDSITITQVMKAIAQFERTLISSNAKFDKYKRGELILTESEFRGLNIFSTEKAIVFIVMEMS
jgi:cytochrome c peroxidase